WWLCSGRPDGPWRPTFIPPTWPPSGSLAPPDHRLPRRSRTAKSAGRPQPRHPDPDDAHSHRLMAGIGSGPEEGFADVLALQDPAVGVGGLSKGVAHVDARLDRALVPEGEDGLEFFAQDGDLIPHAADVDAADRPIVVHQLQRGQQRDASHLGGKT